MNTSLLQFDIFGLHGVRDYSIRFQDNKIIIVGENGSGKTTIFKMMYFTLSTDWDSLRTFAFEKICLHFDGCDKIVITSELLQSIFAIDDIDRIGYYADGRFRGRRIFVEGLLNTVIQVKAQINGKSEDDLDRYLATGPVPYGYIQKIIDNPAIEHLYTVTSRISECFDAQVLYMPTYRRIEEQLKNIFPHVDNDEWEKSRRKTKNEKAIELVEFGMTDVEKAVKTSQESLRAFSQAHQEKLTLGYLGEIVSKSYDHVKLDEIKSLSDEQIAAILQRIDSSILTDEKKADIIKIISTIRTNTKRLNVQQKIICHYFLKLIAFDKEISEEEASMLKFVEKCNKYLVSNNLVYDSKSFSCKIYNKVDGKINISEEIQFQDLSSGEKQIVSLFSHLNLTQNRSIYVFIDEPELSLSVDWQRMILVDILDSDSCCGLIATTHSPFVFENELEEYVHGINEFCIRG